MTPGLKDNCYQLNNFTINCLKFIHFSIKIKKELGEIIKIEIMQDGGGMAADWHWKVFNHHRFTRILRRLDTIRIRSYTQNYLSSGILDQGSVV